MKINEISNDKLHVGMIVTYFGIPAIVTKINKDICFIYIFGEGKPHGHWLHNQEANTVIYCKDVIDNREEFKYQVKHLENFLMKRLEKQIEYII